MAEHALAPVIDPHVVKSDNDDGWPGAAFGSTEEMRTVVTVDEAHPAIFFSTMIAPSPDWFIGAPSIVMCDPATGEWRSSLIPTALSALDAGVAEGTEFATTDGMQDQAVPIDEVAVGEASDRVLAVYTVTSYEGVTEEPETEALQTCLLYTSPSPRDS